LFERIVEREEFVIRKGSSDLDLVQILTGHAAAMEGLRVGPIIVTVFISLSPIYASHLCQIQKCHNSRTDPQRPMFSM
jgi:hypothetical protein